MHTLSKAQRDICYDLGRSIAAVANMYVYGGGLPLRTGTKASGRQQPSWRARISLSNGKLIVE